MPAKIELDKGYSWVILLVSFFYNMIESGLYMSSAVYMVEWLQFYDTSKAKVGLVGSLMSGMNYIVAVFVGPLVDRFSCRTVSYFGLSLTVLGLLCSAVCPSVDWLLLTYGLLVGSGEGLMQIQATLMVQYYFDKKRPFAAGISLCGQSVGTIVTLPLVSVLIGYYGIRGTLVLHTGIIMQNFVLASFFRPIDSNSSHIKDKSDLSESNQKQKSNQNMESGMDRSDTKTMLKQKKASLHRIRDLFHRVVRLWDFSLFKNRAFVQFLIAFAVQGLSTALMYRFTSVKAVADGVSPLRAAFLPSITGICAACSRLMSSIIANLPCVNRTFMCGMAALLQGIVIMVSCVAYNFQTYAVFMGMYGVLIGMQFTVHPTVLADLISVKKLAHGSSFLSISVAMTVLASFPVAGWIIDTTGNYDTSYYIYGGTTCVSGLLIATIPFIYKPEPQVPLEKEDFKPLDKADFKLSRGISTPIFVSQVSLHTV